MLTRRPRIFSRRPRLEAVSPLPRLDATPPVTKTCLVRTGRWVSGDDAKIGSRGQCRRSLPVGPRGLRISGTGLTDLDRHWIARTAGRYRAVSVDLRPRCRRGYRTGDRP